MNIKKFHYFLAILSFLFLALMILTWKNIRIDDKSCENYTYKDAISYVSRNISGFENKASVKYFSGFRGNLKICNSRNFQGSSSYQNPFVVPICSMDTERVIGYAEVYPDCGLEWRRQASY